MDRARAVRLSMKCMAFLEEQAHKIKTLKVKNRKAMKSSAAVITIQGSQIVLAPVADVEDAADMKNRRGMDPWWANLKDLAETLGGKTDLMEYVDSV
ncbi:6-phosphofructokinase, alpha subunit [Tulasnella sp. 427]|nr:6-phosphofructokinase, alpha subunit [Tulasnella sp. 427]